MFNLINDTAAELQAFFSVVVPPIVGISWQLGMCTENIPLSTYMKFD